MRQTDVDLKRIEENKKKLSISDFLASYNKNLPPAFPRASLHFLKEFQKTYPVLFTGENSWSLDQHRKKFMDWHPRHAKPSF